MNNNNMAKVKKVVWAIVKYVSLLLGAFVSVLPVVVCIITAFKSPEEYAETNVMDLPKSWTYFKNFTEAWDQANMALAFRNSIIILVCVLFFAILTGSMLAYILDRFKFFGNGLIRNLFLFASLLPGIAMQVSVYQIMYQLGWINNIAGYIVLMCGTDVISIYIFIQFFENISKNCTKIGFLHVRLKNRGSRRIYKFYIKCEKEFAFLFKMF